ncbi:MAG: hypothetical protein ABW001_03100 [Mycobacterium sp.]
MRADDTGIGAGAAPARAPALEADAGLTPGPFCDEAAAGLLFAPPAPAPVPGAVGPGGVGVAGGSGIAGGMAGADDPPKPPDVPPPPPPPPEKPPGTPPPPPPPEGPPPVVVPVAWLTGAWG